MWCLQKSRCIIANAERKIERREEKVNVSAFFPPWECFTSCFIIISCVLLRQYVVHFSIFIGFSVVINSTIDDWCVPEAIYTADTHWCARCAFVRRYLWADPAHSADMIGWKMAGNFLCLRTMDGYVRCENRHSFVSIKFNVSWA